MKIVYLPAISTALVVISTVLALERSQENDARFATTKSNRKIHDNFYKMIEERKPVEDALEEALTWDVEAQYEHFELLQQHVQDNDEYAEYCKEVIKAAQELLDKTLQKIQIKRQVDICDYVKGLYDFEAARPISEDIQEIIRGINDYRNTVMKELEEEQARNRTEANAQPEEVDNVRNEEPQQTEDQQDDPAVNEKHRVQLTKDAYTTSSQSI